MGLHPPLRRPWTPGALSARRRRVRGSRSWPRSRSRRPCRLGATRRHARSSWRSLPTRAREGRRGWPARVISVGEELLHRLGVAFHELVECQLVSLDKLVYIFYSRHLEVTSTVDAFSFPKGNLAIILRYSPNVGEKLSEKGLGATLRAWI